MNQRESPEKLLTPSELTEILGLKRSCIYRMLRSGQLPCVRVAAGERKLSLRVRPSALEKWLKAREVSNGQM
jgi:excisionase family DNA binding protein